MARLTWSPVGQRFYEIGVDRGVLYIDNAPGVAWSGLVSMEENPSGGEAIPYYLDGVKYLNRSSKEEFEGTLSAFYSPPEFDECDGMAVIHPGLYAAQQRRKPFALSYRSKIGNDLDGSNHAYKIHILFNALASPTQHKYESTGDKSDAGLLAWDISTKPVYIPDVGYTAHLVIDTTTAPAYSVQTLEDMLYGTDEDPAVLPPIEDIIALFEEGAGPLVVTDIGNDQFSISGSGLAVRESDEADQFEITADTVVFIDEDTAEISSE